MVLLSEAVYLLTRIQLIHFFKKQQIVTYREQCPEKGILS